MAFKCVNEATMPDKLGKGQNIPDLGVRLGGTSSPRMRSILTRDGTLNKSVEEPGLRFVVFFVLSSR